MNVQNLFEETSNTSELIDTPMSIVIRQGNFSQLNSNPTAFFGMLNSNPIQIASTSDPSQPDYNIETSNIPIAFSATCNRSKPISNQV
jgi:hypothetical protein